MFANLNRAIVLPMLFCLVLHTDANIFSLNDTEYRQMPTLYAMDDYEDCLLAPGAVYCVLELELFSQGPSPLLDMIRGYSSVTSKHFNHSRLHRGACAGGGGAGACAGGRDLARADAADLTTAFSACLNDSIWRQYGLQARVVELQSCGRAGEEHQLDASDYAALAVLATIILLNAIGTFYDLLKTDQKGNPYLMAFSVRRNWGRLVAPGGAGPEPRLARLNMFNGLRAMTIICVIFSHTSFILTFSFVENPLYIEKSFDDVSKQILFNGSLVVSTFFVMSGFLLAFNWQLHAETHRVGWRELPKGVLLRWIRLTPPYALVLGLVATLMRRLGAGPLWGPVVGSESAACRRYWWAHLLYINNYIYDDYACFPQSWYLAADTQLFCLGLALLAATGTAGAAGAAGARRRALAALAVLAALGLLAPALHTYLQDLDATVMQSPETVRSVYKEDATFRYVYVGAHTNLAAYVLGLAGGLLAHRWMSDQKNYVLAKKYRVLVWLTFPTAVCVILSGALFYGDTRAALAARVLYAALYKPAFQLLVVFFIVALIFKAESVYRGIVEWRGWSWAGRASYCAFLVHAPLQRALVGALRRPLLLSDYLMVVCLSGFVALSFLCAALLWLLVEAPTKQLSSAALAPRGPPRARAHAAADHTKC